MWKICCTSCAVFMQDLNAIGSYKRLAKYHVLVICANSAHPVDKAFVAGHSQAILQAVILPNINDIHSNQPGNCLQNERMQGLVECYI